MKNVNEEKSIIEMITAMFPESRQRLNKCFESDAEMLVFEDKQLLFTIDEFSSEDMFRDSDPYSLGWNVAAGGISDISACAGIPLFYGHAMVVSATWDKEFIKKFTKGVADALKEADIAFIGGDFGKAKDWHYAAAIIGKPGKKSLSRKGAEVGDGIYLSGRVGLGNLEAALKFYSDDKRLKLASGIVKCRFPLRLKESAFIGEYATCCIDTSDGVFNSLNILAEINNVGYEIKDLPYIDIGSFGAGAMSLPEELLFLGEAGEYELLFTIKPKDGQGFMEKAKQAGFTFYKIGEITDSSRVLVGPRGAIDLTTLGIRARDFDDRKKYLEYLVNYLEERK